MVDCDISILYGNQPKAMVRKIMGESGVEREIGPNARIGIKPNLVVAKPSSSGATTSPEIIEGIIEYLQEKGYRNLVILEGSWIGEQTSKAFKACGYREISKQYQVPLIDLQKDSYRGLTYDGLNIHVCESVLNLDYLINVPVLKGHCQTNITCALKNMKGCIPNFEKRRFHTMGLHKPIAYLNKLIRQNLIIVDGMAGDLNFEEGGNPVAMNRILAGNDPVLIDAYAAKLLGYRTDEIPYIGIAEAIGVGSSDTDKAIIRELNKDSGSNRIPSSRKVRQLARYVVEDCACSACYGSLIHALQRLDERGKLIRLNTKIYIGQNFKGKTADGIGVGSCTVNFEKQVPGCPPTAREIIEYLEQYGL